MAFVKQFIEYLTIFLVVNGLLLKWLPIFTLLFNYSKKSFFHGFNEISSISHKTMIFNIIIQLQANNKKWMFVKKKCLMSKFYHLMFILWHSLVSVWKPFTFLLELINVTDILNFIFFCVYYNILMSSNCNSIFCQIFPQK